jgi:hypothetical protein
MQAAVASAGAPDSVAVRAPQQQGVKYVCGGESLGVPNGHPCTMSLTAPELENRCTNDANATVANNSLPVCAWCRWAGRVRVREPLKSQGAGAMQELRLPNFIQNAHTAK